MVSQRLRCNVERREVWFGDAALRLPLSVQEFDLLNLLCSRFGEVLSRDELGAAIWGAGNFEYNMLHRLVHRTRRKLDVHAPGSIFAIARVGYKVDLPPDSSDTEPQAQAFGETEFVGREHELQQLQAAFDDTAGGGGLSIVMLAGEPGIGKTSVAQEFARRCAGKQGARVLTGRCYDGDGAMPYAPIVDATRSYVRSEADGPLRAALGNEARELALLLPELHTRFADVPEPVALEPDLERLRLFESLSQILRRIASHAPLVLIVDDLHWADKSTLMLLQYIRRSAADQPILIIATYRDVEVDRRHPLADTLAALRREPRFHQVMLSGLAADEIRDFFPGEGDGVPEGLVAELYRETEGNPFFVRELVGHLLQEGSLRTENGRWIWTVSSLAELRIPEGVRHLIERRLSRLSADCNRLLSVISATNDGIDWEILLATIGVSDEQLLNALDEALDCRILDEKVDGRTVRYDLSHALIRQTLYASLSAPRRELLHRTIGEALERAYAHDELGRDRHLAEIAYHFSQSASEQPARAVTYAQRAGERAVRSVAYEEAVAHFARALAIHDAAGHGDIAVRYDILRALGDAHMRAGNLTDGRASVVAAAEAARALQSPERLAGAALALEPGWAEAGVLDEECIALLEEADQALEGAESAQRAQVLASLALRIYYTASAERRLGLSRDALDMARRVAEPTALAHALLVRHRLLTLQFPDDPVAALREQLDVATELVEVAQAIHDGDREFQGRVWRLLDYFQLGDLEAVDREQQMASALADRLKQPLPLFLRAGFAAARAVFEGRFEEGEALINEALRVGQRAETMASLAVQVFALQMFSLRWEQGRLHEIEGIIRVTVARYPAVPAFRGALAFMCSSMELTDEARAEFDAVAADDFASLPKDGAWVGAMTTLAQVCWYLGDGERARVLYALLLPHRNHCILVGDASVCMGAASRYTGMLAATAGMWAEAEEHFTHAIAFNERLGSPSHVAHTQFEFASMLLRRGEPGDAERASVLVDAATVTARNLGMLALETSIERMIKDAA